MGTHAHPSASAIVVSTNDYHLRFPYRSTSQWGSLHFVSHLQHNQRKFKSSANATSSKRLDIPRDQHHVSCKEPGIEISSYSRANELLRLYDTRGISQCSSPTHENKHLAESDHAVAHRHEDGGGAPYRTIRLVDYQVALHGSHSSLLLAINQQVVGFVL